MASMLVTHCVKDFAEWKKTFDLNIGLRKSFGELSSQVFVDASDSKKVTMISRWDSMANAKKFTQSPELKAAMEKAGVEGPPEISFLNEA